VSRWRRQQRKRARRRRDEDAADLEFGRFLEAWGRELRQAFKVFGDGVVYAAGELARFAAHWRAKETQRQDEERGARECL